MPNSPIFEQTVKATEEAMSKILEFLANELRGIRSGRATAGLVENVRVDSYGNLTPLKNLANISVPEARMIVIRPFEATALKSIETGLTKANLGFSISNDGRLLRISIPPLSEETRQKLITQVKDHTEKAKVSLRNIRRDNIKQVEQLEKNSKLSEDESKRLQTKIQDVLKSYEEKAGKKFEEKKKEILEF